MAGLTLSQAGIDDRIRHKLNEARGAGADGLDIRMAMETGMDARDIMNLRRFTREKGLLLIVRCPKTNAAAFHGDMRAKAWATKEHTNATGTVYSENGRLMVSDYDMMSLWRFTGTGYQKIYVSALKRGAAQGVWSKEASRLVRTMNLFLITRIQHGCQDDFENPADNRGVEMTDCFLAIRMGDAVFLPSPVFCENFYAAHALHWPYGAQGKFIG
jgi:hypothetical protein